MGVVHSNKAADVLLVELWYCLGIGSFDEWTNPFNATYAAEDTVVVVMVAVGGSRVLRKQLEFDQMVIWNSFKLMIVSGQ